MKIGTQCMHVSTGSIKMETLLKLPQTQMDRCFHEYITQTFHHLDKSQHILLELDQLLRLL